MKVIAGVTLVGKNRELLPPGSEIDLPKGEAESLLERGFVSLPDSKSSKAQKSESAGDDNQTEPAANQTDSDPENQS